MLSRPQRYSVLLRGVNSLIAMWYSIPIFFFLCLSLELSSRWCIADVALALSISPRWRSFPRSYTGTYRHYFSSPLWLELASTQNLTLTTVLTSGGGATTLRHSMSNMILKFFSWFFWNRQDVCYSKTLNTKYQKRYFSSIYSKILVNYGKGCEELYLNVSFRAKCHKSFY